MKATEQQRAFYDHLMLIYDIIEDMLSAIEADGVKNSEDQLAIAEPLIQQAQESSEKIIEFYINFIESGAKIASSSEKRFIESEIRKLDSSIVAFAKKAKELVY